MSNPQQSFPDPTLDAGPLTPPQRSRLGRKKSPPPFSLSLTKEEQAKTEHDAAGMPLGPLIKAKLFEGDVTTSDA